MASTVDMDIEAARKWQQSIEDLNKRLAEVLNGVNESVQTIEKVSEGSIISVISQNVKEMFEAATDLVNAFTGLVKSVADVITAATGLADKIVDGLKVVGKVGALFGL
jgi:methyl-accepting chemotaxis protein